MVEKLRWTVVETGMGWNRHEGISDNYGPYTVEKEDVRSFSVWWGHFEIAEASTYASARREAQAHCNSLQHIGQKEGSGDG